MRLLNETELDWVAGAGDPLTIDSTSTSAVLTPEQRLAMRAGLIPPAVTEKLLERDATTRSIAGGWANCSDLGGGNWSCLFTDTPTLDQSNFFQIHNQLGTGPTAVLDLYQQSNLTDYLDTLGINVGRSGLNLNMLAELQSYMAANGPSIDVSKFAAWLAQKHLPTDQIDVIAKKISETKDAYSAQSLDAFVAFAQWQIAHIETASYLYNDYRDPDDFRDEDSSEYYRV